MSSLCIADALNILNSIVAIAKSVHREDICCDSAAPYMSTSIPGEVSDEGKDSIKDRTRGSSSVAKTAEDVTATAHEGPQSDDKELMSLAPQLEAASISKGSSGPPSPVTHPTCEEFFAQISSDESDSKTESDDSPGSDELAEDGKPDSGHVTQSSSSCAGKGATVSSDLGETGTVSSSKEDGDDRFEVRDGVSTFSHVKSKFFSGRNGESKPKKGQKKGNRQRTEHRPLSSRQRSSSQPSRRKSKPLLLYGMGAGSFNVVESYMNT